MHAERFRHLLNAKGPFGSIYFDDSHDTEDANAQLELKWRAIRQQLEEHDVSSEMIADAERAIVGVHPPVGRKGRAVIAGADGVLLDEHLLAPASTTIVRVSDLPYIVPVIEHGPEHPTYVLAAVDHTGADITLRPKGAGRAQAAGAARSATFTAGAARPATFTVDGGGYPVHKASGAETSGYGDPQPRTEEQVRKNIRAVAERLTALFDESSPAVVFLIGEVRSRADLISELPERLTAHVVELHVGARRSGVDSNEITKAVEAEFDRRRLAAIDDASQRFTAERGRLSGLAAEGLAEVCEALRDGAVDTLIIGDLGDATVVAGDDLAAVAADPDQLSDLGEAPARTLRADEALPLLAVSTDASLVRVDERLTPRDGIAAVLRYAPMGR